MTCSTTTSKNCSPLLFALALAACAAPSAANPPAGEGAPVSAGAGGGGSARTTDFALRDTDGRMVRLSDHLGKQVILLNFWATWCVPCAAELPHLEKLYEAHKKDGFLILGIAMDGPESVANVGPQARRYGLTFPILLDEETRVVGIYNPKRSAPYNVLISRDGVVTKTREGYSSGDDEAIASDVEALLGPRAK